jgi:hypothetical protein
MKVIHIIKKIEAVDDDIRELRKLEKSLARDKSFSTPIYMSIEKQINILLGDRIKLLELKIANPPADLVKEIEGGSEPSAKKEEKAPSKEEKLIQKKTKPRKERSAQISGRMTDDDDDSEEIDDIGILTQDLIDEKFARLKEEKEQSDRKIMSKLSDDDEDEDITDESIKLLDVALENGTLNKSSLDKEKKKVKFFKDNFPGSGEY